MSQNAFITPENRRRVEILTYHLLFEVAQRRRADLTDCEHLLDSTSGDPNPLDKLKKAMEIYEADFRTSG